MLETDLYMACIDLRGRRALVVGGTDAALEKTQALVACAAQVTVVAEELAAGFDALLASGSVAWERRAYRSADLDGHLLVIAANGERALDERVYEEAEARAMLVNVVDVPDLCNFISPAVARRGPIAIAVTTSGASPALAQRIRAEVNDAIDEPYASLAYLLDQQRAWARDNLPDYASRKSFFASIVGADPDPIGLLRAGDDDAVARLIETARQRALG